MKNINFIITLSPQQQREIRFWWTISCILFVITLATISYFAIPQLYNLYTLKNSIADLTQKTINYTSVTTKKNDLKKENVALSRKKKRIETYLNDPRNPHKDLTVIIQAIHSPTTKIEQIRSNKKTIDLIVTCTSPEIATNLVKNLAENSLFASVKLTTLEQAASTKQFKCIIKISRA
jgi:hypothetical protein